MCVSYDTSERIFGKSGVPHDTLWNLWVNMLHVTVSPIFYLQDFGIAQYPMPGSVVLINICLSYTLCAYRFTALATHLQCNEFKYIYHRNLIFLATCQ